MPFYHDPADSSKSEPPDGKEPIITIGTGDKFSLKIEGGDFPNGYGCPAPKTKPSPLD